MLLHNILNMDQPQTVVQMPCDIFVSESCIGLEIEIESRRQETLQFWNRVSEGSISGYEIVLKHPMYGFELYEAIEELAPLASRLEDSAFSARTSVHCHVDVRDMTFVQLMNFLTLSMMFEPVLYRYVAPHRSGNHFCWSTLDCQNLVSSIAEMYRRCGDNPAEELAREYIRSFSPDRCKYAGINLSSIRRYGSLEFRMHEGTMDRNALIRWINILLSIKEYAMQPDKTPLNILETKQDQGIESIFEAVLGQYAGVLTYEGVDNDILNGIRVVQDFVYEATKPSTPSVPPVSDSSVFRNLIASCNERILTDRGRDYASSNSNT